MAQIFRVALAADPALKDSKAAFGKETPLYQLSMRRMVAEDVVPRLCQGWEPWAKQQADEWEQMPDGAAEAAKEAERMVQTLASS